MARVHSQLGYLFPAQLLPGHRHIVVIPYTETYLSQRAAHVHFRSDSLFPARRDTRYVKSYIILPIMRAARPSLHRSLARWHLAPRHRVLHQELPRFQHGATAAQNTTVENGVCVIDVAHRPSDPLLESYPHTHAEPLAETTNPNAMPGRLGLGAFPLLVALPPHPNAWLEPETDTTEYGELEV